MVCFQYQADAERFKEVLVKRLAKFELAYRSPRLIDDAGESDSLPLYLISGGIFGLPDSAVKTGPDLSCSNSCSFVQNQAGERIP